MTDGTYTGEGKGRNGTITVEVTVKAGKLDAVKVVKHTETVGISDAAVADFPKAIVAAQSTAVDAVAGATMTSEGIRTAVAQAIQKAGGDPAQFATAVVKKKAAKKLVKENADIVVVGAGGSGISAAVKAETLQRDPDRKDAGDRRRYGSERRHPHRHGLEVSARSHEGNEGLARTRLQGHLHGRQEPQ
jgi:hypothetical protein